MSRSTHYASSVRSPTSIEGRNPGSCCTCFFTKDHWEPSACNSILITCVSGKVSLPLTPRQRQTRLLWCHGSVDWRVEWGSGVFREESRFCLYASDERTRVLRRPSERHLPECIRSRHTALFLRLHDVSGHQLPLVDTFGVSAG